MSNLDSHEQGTSLVAMLPCCMEADICERLGQS